MPSIAHIESTPRYAPQAVHTELASNRPRREVPAAETGPPSPRSLGDRELAGLYGQALARTTGVPSHDNALMLDKIPPNSTFGQWWSQLGRAFQSPNVIEWMRERGINSRTLKLNAYSGQITFEFQRHIGKPGVHTLGLDDPQWSKVSGPVIAAATVIGGNSWRSYTPALMESSTTAPLELVARFYQEKPLHCASQISQRSAQLEQTKAFPALEPAHFSALIESRSEQELEGQKAVIGNIRTQHDAAHSLRHFANLLKGGTRTHDEIRAFLNTNKVNIDPHSAYNKAHVDKWNDVSLLQFLHDNDLDIPADAAQMDNLATALFRPAPTSPAHANYGGALNWPEPLEPVSLRQLRADIRHGKFGEIDLRPLTNVLEYLLQHAQIHSAQTQNPRRSIDALINTPRARALGEAIQATFASRGVKGSATDWLMAAMSADPNDTVMGSSATRKNRSKAWVLGYPLSSSVHAGKPAAAIVKELANHLQTSGKASSADKAAIQAHLLLSSRAPEFLVKNIPDEVSPGTHSWVTFVTGVARIEANAPGATALMSYGQVMLETDIAPICAQDRHVEYAAQTQALRDWGSANGMGFALTDTAMAEVREAYHSHIQELRAASRAHASEMPDARGMALAQLKTIWPETDPALFDKKCITSQPFHQDFPGPYSLLDLYMDERGVKGSTPATPSGQQKSHWVSSSSAVKLDTWLKKINDLPPLSTLFDNAFSDYCASVEKSASTQVKHLISKLPRADRENLEFGKITVLKEWKNSFAAYSMIKQREPATNGNLLIKTELDGQFYTYEIDLKNNRVVQREELGNVQTGDFPPNSQYAPRTFTEVLPSGAYAPDLLEEKSFGRAPPRSFSSPKTAYLADAMVKEMNIGALKSQAKGLTTFDTEVPFYKIAHDFMLNLIPLRSAIKHFANGNIGDGINDLTLDAFGFAVGLSAAAKGAKAAQAGVSAFGKLARGGKIVGRAAIGSLNPLSGIGDLAHGVVSAGNKAFAGARSGIKQLHQALTRFDPAALTKKAGIATGTAKATDELIILAKLDEKTARWYALDAKTRQPYGPPLKDFQPTTLSNGELTDNLNLLYKKLDKEPQLDICYATALRAAQADKKITDTAFRRFIPEVLNGGSARYNQVMNIQPGTLKSTFNLNDISESGIITFVSRQGYNKDNIVHAAYIHKATDGNLYLYHSNSLALDHALGGTKVTPGSAGIANVYKLGSEQQAGMQQFMDSVGGYDSVFTPSSALESNIRALAA